MPTIVADKTAALLASTGLMAALLHRFRTGQGVYLETSMFEGMVGYTLLEHQHGTIFNPREGEAGYPRALSPARRPHPTADGFICMLAYTDKQWERFWSLAGQPARVKDPRFDSLASRSNNIDALYGLAGEVLRQRSTREWLALLNEADIPAGPVNQLADLRADPHLVETGFFRPFEHPPRAVWKCRTLRFAWTVSRFQSASTSRPWANTAGKYLPRLDSPLRRSRRSSEICNTRLFQAARARSNPQLSG
ncbi:MAG: hypothetical protein Ct9H300mP16_06250 [Pseudomonadota bacterium]|nr:MAG: hypothetical protein Ct9H300mP16_06250 [Pseudomonadota bacterium]